MGFACELARIVASYERDRSLRDDLLQEVFIAVVSSLPRLAQPSKLKPFVFRIAHNRCLSHVVKQMRECTRKESLDDLAAAPEAPSLIREVFQFAGNTATDYIQVVYQALGGCRV